MDGMGGVEFKFTFRDIYVLNSYSINMCIYIDVFI